MPITTAIILAAGQGTRLDPARTGTGKQHATGEAHVKPLVKLAGRTLLRRSMDGCRAAGMQRIVVVTGFRAPLVESAVDGYSGDGCLVETVFNPGWRRSNGLSLHAARHRVRENFLLLMADHLFDTTILSDLAAIQLKPNTVSLAVDRKIDQVFDLDDATKVRLGERAHILSIGKQLADYNAVDCGFFACTPGIFDALSDAMVDGDCSISDGMTAMIQQNGMYGFDIGDRTWQDVDTPEMYGQALRLARQMDANQPPAHKTTRPRLRQPVQAQAPGPRQA